MAKKSAKEEARIVIRPIGGLGGLDNIHVILIALAIVLVALLLVVSSQAKGAIAANSSCTYGSSNGICVMPLHNLSSVKIRVGQILASYAYVNGSLSVLPYYSSIQNATYDYLPQSREWLASVPVQNPGSGGNFFTSFLIYDSNFSLVRPYIQTISTSQIVSNYVAAKGAVRLSGKVACLQQAQTQVYWFIDPYSAGSISSLNSLTALQSKFGSKINATLKIVFGSDSLSIANKVGVNNTVALGKYVWCASRQANFTTFVSNLQSLYSNSYVSAANLNLIVNQSKLNVPSFNGCLANATTTINAQALLAQYYNITSTPTAITNCIYQSIPQTVQSSICLANSKLC